MRGWAVGREHTGSSVVVDAANVDRIGTNELEHDPILVVHAHRMPPFQVACQRVKAVPRRDPEIVEFRYRVQLVELPSDDRPEVPRTWRAALELMPFQMSLVVSSANVRITD
jgi:hypothetical protein